MTKIKKTGKKIKLAAPKKLSLEKETSVMSAMIEDYKAFYEGRQTAIASRVNDARVRRFLECWK